MTDPVGCLPLSLLTSGLWSSALYFPLGVLQPERNWLYFFSALEKVTSNLFWFRLILEKQWEECESPREGYSLKGYTGRLRPWGVPFSGFTSKYKCRDLTSCGIWRGREIFHLVISKGLQLKVFKRMHLGAEPSRIELYRCTPRRRGEQIHALRKLQSNVSLLFYCIPGGITAVIIWLRIQNNFIMIGWEQADFFIIFNLHCSAN